MCEISRRLCDMFMKLPSKRQFADYFDVIKRPIDLNTIGEKIMHDYKKYGAQPPMNLSLFSTTKRKLESGVGACSSIRSHTREIGSDDFVEWTRLTQSRKPGGASKQANKPLPPLPLVLLASISFRAFESDVNLLVNNAKKYNVPGSKVYEDAVALHKVRIGLGENCFRACDV